MEMAFIQCKHCGAGPYPTGRYYDYNANQWVYKSVDCLNCGQKTGEGRS